MIFAELQKSQSSMPRGSIRPSTLSCKPLRDVAVNYLYWSHPRITGTDELELFLRFMDTNHGPANTVRHIVLSSAVLDVKSIDQIRRLFPRLVDISLTDLTYCPPLIHHHDSQPGPADLTTALCVQGLSFSCTRATSGWTLSGMMDILSLLQPRDCNVTIELEGYSREAFDPRRIAGFSAVRNLVLRYKDPTSKKSIGGLLDALSQTLDPNALDNVEVQYDSKESLLALGRMLERVGRNVTRLTVCPNAPETLAKREAWMDPFDGESTVLATDHRHLHDYLDNVAFAMSDWRLLDIRPCQKLVYICLHIYVRRKENVSKYLSHVGVGLLENYAPPATLGKVVIRIHDLPRAATLGNRSVLRLQAFDKVFTEARFPRLWSFFLKVGITEDLYDTWEYKVNIEDAACRALRGLATRGLLEIFVQSWFDV